jgi:hypothetical protein
MSAKIEYRLIYNRDVDLNFTCFCSETRVCSSCAEREENCSEWYELPFYNLSRENGCIPRWGVATEDKLYDILEELHYIKEGDEDYVEAQDAIIVFLLLAKEVGDYAIEFRWD